MYFKHLKCFSSCWLYHPKYFDQVVSFIVLFIFSIPLIISFCQLVLTSFCEVCKSVPLWLKFCPLSLLFLISSVLYNLQLYAQIHANSLLLFFSLWLTRIILKSHFLSLAMLYERLNSQKACRTIYTTEPLSSSEFPSNTNNSLVTLNTWSCRSLFIPSFSDFLVGLYGWREVLLKCKAGTDITAQLGDSALVRPFLATAFVF